MALVEAWPEEDGNPDRFASSAQAMTVLLSALSAPIEGPLEDPAGLSGRIDDYLEDDDRERVIQCLERDAEAAEIARRHQERGDHERAIRKWQSILGVRFPAYR